MSDWTVPVATLLGGGGAKYAYDFVKDRMAARDARPSTRQQQAADVDASILTVAKARDELAEDNTRLRETLREERLSHAVDRTAWMTERDTLRGEVVQLEDRLRVLLGELTDVKSRLGIT